MNRLEHRNYKYDNDEVKYLKYLNRIKKPPQKQTFRLEEDFTQLGNRKYRIKR